MKCISLKTAGFASAILAAGLVSVVMGEAFDCNNYNPNICTMDAILFCLTNGTVVTGRCYAQRAVCLENQRVDGTFAACRLSHAKFDCANPEVCTRDLIPFCLDNATIVHGSCSAKQAVCKENRQVVDDFSPCNKAGAEQRTKDDSGNSAVGLTATASILLGLLLLSAMF